MLSEEYDEALKAELEWSDGEDKGEL